MLWWGTKWTPVRRILHLEDERDTTVLWRPLLGWGRRYCLCLLREDDRD